MTQEQIDQAIKQCEWRQKFGDTYICRGMCLPCQRVIEKGECPTLKELFSAEKEIKE